jgi:hypothetical protein
MAIINSETSTDLPNTSDLLDVPSGEKGGNGTESSRPRQVNATYLYELHRDSSRQSNLENATQLREEIEAGKTDNIKRLFVVHGLPVDQLEVLRDSLNIPNGFIEAHARRHCYRPLRAWDKDVQYAHFDYPELVQGEAVSYRPLSFDATDLMGEPPVHFMSKAGDAALFCHASLWKSEDSYGKWFCLV